MDDAQMGLIWAVIFLWANCYTWWKFRGAATVRCELSGIWEGQRHPWLFFRKSGHLNRRSSLTLYYTRQHWKRTDVTWWLLFTAKQKINARTNMADARTPSLSRQEFSYRTLILLGRLGKKKFESYKIPMPILWSKGDPYFSLLLFLVRYALHLILFYLLKTITNTVWRKLILLIT
jgi:hypothetical protein